MPQFVVLIWEAEEPYATGDHELFAEVLAAHTAFGTKYRGSVQGGEALHPAASAKIIRDGVVTDGPFLETKEALGGYYVLEADDLDQATAMAAEVPARFGFVEVRAVQVFD